MQCPRCFYNLEKISEYYFENKYKKQYYCFMCQSSLTENFNNQGLCGSEWVDFNV